MRVINDRLHDDVRLPNTMVCPYCGAYMNTATSAYEAGDKVEDGDYGLCAGCAEVCITVISKQGLSLRKPTEQEIEDAKCSSMYAIILEYQELIRSKKSGLKVKK